MEGTVVHDCFYADIGCIVATATSVYIMCISWTIGSVISVGIMFLFDVALQEDRRKARQVVALNHQVEATTINAKSHAAMTSDSSVRTGTPLPENRKAIANVLAESSPNEIE